MKYRRLGMGSGECLGAVRCLHSELADDSTQEGERVGPTPPPSRFWRSQAATAGGQTPDFSAFRACWLVPERITAVGLFVTVNGRPVSTAVCTLLCRWGEEPLPIRHSLASIHPPIPHTPCTHGCTHTRGFTEYVWVWAGRRVSGCGRAPWVWVRAGTVYLCVGGRCGSACGRAPCI